MGADGSKPEDAKPKQYAFNSSTPKAVPVGTAVDFGDGKKHVSLAVMEDVQQRVSHGGHARMSSRQSLSTSAADSNSDAANEWMRRSAALDRAFSRKKMAEMQVDIKQEKPRKKGFFSFGAKSSRPAKRAKEAEDKPVARSAPPMDEDVGFALLDTATVRDVDRLIELIMAYGRRYDEGEVLITFAEMQDHYFEASHEEDEWSDTLPELLFKAARARRLNYHRYVHAPTTHPPLCHDHASADEM